MTVDAGMGSLAASSARSSSLPRERSPELVRPSTARLKHGKTSSSTMSSRNTASGSKASLSSTMQSVKACSLLMGLLHERQGTTVDECAARCRESFHRRAKRLGASSFSLFGRIDPHLIGYGASRRFTAILSPPAPRRRPGRRRAVRSPLARNLPAVDPVSECANSLPGGS